MTLADRAGQLRMLAVTRIIDIQTDANHRYFTTAALNLVDWMEVAKQQVNEWKIGAKPC